MRRWTVMFIPHDTERPHSISVSGRVLRVAASVAMAVVLVALIGVGAIIAQRGEVGAVGVTRGVERERVAAVAAPSADVESLRQQVRALNGTLDTIRKADARLRAVAGVVPGSSASTDSLQHRASGVAARFGTLADSAMAPRGDVLQRARTPLQNGAGARRP